MRSLLGEWDRVQKLLQHLLREVAVEECKQLNLRQYGDVEMLLLEVVVVTEAEDVDKVV